MPALRAAASEIGWMIDEEHIEPDDDPDDRAQVWQGESLALERRSGAVDRRGRGEVSRAWPLGTEARLIFDILHYIDLQLGDASRFGMEKISPWHLNCSIWLASARSSLIIPGIGFAIARELTEHCAAVILNGRDRSKLDVTAASLTAGGHKVDGAGFDVTVAEAVREGVATIEQTIGALDILVNNAGMQFRL
jgi:hypothetical protein